MKSQHLFKELEHSIEQLDTAGISEERKKLLQPLTEFIQQKVTEQQDIYLNFICTHNSRRSHLAQIWTQALAYSLGIQQLYSFSGGTKETAMAPLVVKTLQKQGFDIHTISEGTNPVYSVKYFENSNPVIGFSKRYDAGFNPKANFAAIMTCSQADGGCPFIAGASARIPITFEDPKLFDGTDLEEHKYEERSLQIATEMLYVLENVTV